MKKCEVSTLKGKVWLTMLVILTVIIIFLFNAKYMDYFSKQVFSQNIKEFKTEWKTKGQVDSFFQTYHDGDLRLARIELGSSWKHVKNIYGESFKTKIETTESPYSSNEILYYTTWIYPDFEVCFVNTVKKNHPKPKELSDIFTITLTSNRFQSYRGVKIGDSINKVKERYGIASSGILDDKGSKFYEWQLSYIRFGVSKGKVSAIEVSQNPD